MDQYTAYIILLISAALGALFVPSARAHCFAVLTLSLVGYGASVFLDGIFGIDRNGFLLALIDVSIGVILVSLFRDKTGAVLGLSFATSAYTHTLMTLAVIEQNANMFYTNYEVIISTTSIIQAIAIFGSALGDAYRYIADHLHRLPDSKHSIKNNKIGEDVA